LDSGTGSPAEQLAGTTVADYRILESVGVGGMGVVYRGWDDRLGRPVAVKVLHPALASEERSRQRFLRETRLACRVIHPYVATVFDVLEKDERLFLVMEYIEGRRLDDVVAEDDPPPKEIARLGLEIAEALAAIHGSGLVHRDLKPGNVKVTPAGHVKVMDFGVAYPMAPPAYAPGAEASQPPPEPTLTQEGHGVGTVSYMSPEQITGGIPDGRSDLFSLGIVLYEALAREHPFNRGSPFATASAILHDAPGSGSEEPKTLTESGALRAIIFRLLEKSPALRYQTSGEVVADLRAALEGRPLLSRPARRTRTMRITAAAVVVATAAGGGWWWWHRRPPSGGDIRPVMAVMPFEDRTADADADVRGEMVARLVAAMVGSDTFARPLSEERVEEIVGKQAATPAVAAASLFKSESGVRWTVTGVLRREAGTDQAAITVYGAGSDQPIGTFRAASAGSAGLVDAIHAGLRRMIAPSAGSYAGPGAARWTSDSEEARLLEQRARRALREYRYRQGTELLDRALELDPKFFTARALLGEALDGAGYLGRAREAVDRAKRDADLAGKAAPERATLEVAATRARVYDAFADEVEAWKSVERLAPDDPDVLLHVAVALWRAARYEEALPYAERARGLDPADGRTPFMEGRVLRSLKRYPDAQAALDRSDGMFAAVKSPSGRARVAEERGALLRAMNRPDDAAKSLAQAEVLYREADLPAPAGRAAMEQGGILLLKGDLSGARRLFDGALKAAADAGDERLVVGTLRDLGTELYVRGADLAEAERVLRDALLRARRLDNAELLLDPLINLSSLLGFTGRPGESLALAQEALTTAKSRGDRNREAVALKLVADAAFQQGDARAALESYADAFRVETSLGADARARSVTRYCIAEIHTATGHLADATQAADDAVALADQSGDRYVRALARLRRAEAMADVGAFKDAAADIDAAVKIAREGGDRLTDPEDLGGLLRGVVELRELHVREASSFLSTAIATGERSGAEGLEVPALIASSRAAALKGDNEAAVSFATRAGSSAHARVSEKIAARAALVEALVAGGRAAEAHREARRTIEEATRAGMDMAAATAGGALAAVSSRGREPDWDELVAKGRDALARVVAGLTPERRASFSARRDVPAIFDRWIAGAAEGAVGRAAEGSGEKQRGKS
jgi:serine/threonine protein kinase/tetratricopeptide (TPR) repeat protein